MLLYARIRSQRDRSFHQGILLRVKDPRKTKYWSSFVRAVERVRALSCDPEEFVIAQFDMLAG